jgi:predicted DNA-binding transcriptional regulator AlpA
MNNPFEIIDARLSNIENLLLDLKHSGKETSSDSEELLTIKQASEFVKLSVPTLYGYVSRNEIPFSKRPNSKRLWFSRKELIDWLQEGKQKTLSQLQDEANTFLKKRR